MNLVPNEETRFKAGSEQVEKSRLAGIKSGEVRRERKAMREQLVYLMSLPIKKNRERLRAQLKDLGIATTEMNVQMAINVAMVQQALKGDTRAYEIIRDTMGEKPVEQIQNINPPIIKIERRK